MTPNSSSKDSLSLLKDYFKRNHQYRTGGFSFKRKFLVYTPFFLDQPLQQRKKSIEIIKRDELGFLNMYDENAIKIIDIEREDSDQLFLNEIKKSYGYEGVFISAHGDPSGHQKNIKSENVINSNAFSINLHSCATGNFLEKDYIAGKYLFEGNSLFVSTQVVPGTERLNLASVYYSLINSKPLYKALKSYQNLSEIGVFGDLTLRMRYIKKPLYHKPKDPIIAISQTSLYIAPKTSGTEGFSLNVKNLGKSSLRFGFVYKELVSPRGYKGGISFGVKNADEEIFSRAIWGMHEYVLNPGSETVINYYFYGMIPGNYKGALYLFSNDPINPVLVVPVKRP